MPAALDRINRNFLGWGLDSLSDRESTDYQSVLLFAEFVFGAVDEFCDVGAVSPGGE